MSENKRLSQVFESAKVIPFNDSSKYIIMSDCHRGDGSQADDFLKNQNLYFAALTQYNKKRYTYIELGDGDELWENDKLFDIKQEHSDVFWLLAEFYKDGRLHMLYGNHDMAKKKEKYMKTHLTYYYSEQEKKLMPLFPGIEVNEGLVLQHEDTGGTVFLVHGHQADFLNDRLWWLAKFLVRHVWRPLELFGVNDPTSTAKNYKKQDKIEKIISDWAGEQNQMVIAGHTHRPMFPEVRQSPYFNDGSCVHPRCITGIEIAEGRISLVKWSVKSRQNGTLYVGRDVIVGPKLLLDYYHATSAQKEDAVSV